MSRVPDDESLIRAALAAAEAVGPRDVPIGAVVVSAEGVELARAANAREALSDPTAHAEILALRAAAGVLGDGWRLEGATLAVTVEPCTMCAGALVMARVARVVFGAWEPKTGAVGSLWDVVRDRRLTHRPQVRGGVLAEECAAPLEEFFARQR
ncbi:tRNA-specific adenosine deaminase [Mycolicibacterium chitae]|uniref:tRNA-specific adenosine deaminase n=1 Tax=Mycolicibacterium chitae TaxID=1792 RepID=A0A448HX68_MYCCI|nr:nucleoside deaminase [Mycolicibacterium chitae]MCV7109052.1 nucleoside deaminase [Mycolicibacterium chitae]BBZ02291.1 tRNA-specific adenosine deaminase [Mycolicibacterium chitae]VEG44586.1 tRNA-specific adenosine deaminase [Mycolicibacterium chitae]